LEDDNIIRFASRMDQLPPYLFGMINKIKMEKRRKGDDVIDLGMGNPKYTLFPLKFNLLIFCMSR